MFKKTVTYTNFNDEEKQKDFWFHLSRTELMGLVGSGGIEERIKRMIATEDMMAILDQMRTIVNMAIGVRSEDGETFIKNDEIRAQLMFSPAYDELLFQLLSDEEAAAEFIKNLLPKKMQQELEEELKKNSAELPSIDPFKEPDSIVPVWEKENRDPTEEELRNMTQSELRKAFARKLNRD